MLKGSEVSRFINTGLASMESPENRISSFLSSKHILPGVCPGHLMTFNFLSPKSNTFPSLMGDVLVIFALIQSSLEKLDGVIALKFSMIPWRVSLI